ncbi:MAG: DnaJ domain-containing protein, partial [Bdellovibrionales bacterium]|nr:DnaJ domain-containing protein [Bdellovibrionales bacterium]
PVVREEIASLEKFLGTLSGLSEKARSVAIEEFRSGKERATSYEKIRNDAFDLYWLHRGRRNSLGEIFRLYLRVAMSDGALNESEEVVLEMISQGFGLGLKETTLIKNSVIREFWSEHKEYYRKASEERKKTEQRLADQARAWIRSSDFTALGLTPEASLDQIKRAYRRLVKECHPDMLQQRGTLSNHDQKEAARRFHEIQTAYDRLIAIKSSAKAA